MTVDTPEGTVVLQNAVYDQESQYLVADVAGTGTNCTFRMASTGDGGVITGGRAELLGADGQLLYAIEVSVNRVSGEETYSQATSQDYLTCSILADDDRVRERYDANGDVAVFDYPALPVETQHRAVNYFEHGLPAASLPGAVGEYVGTLGEFSDYYQPHSTSTLEGNPDGQVLVAILTSPDVKSLAVSSGGPPEDRKWAGIDVACAAARACQTLVCYTHPTSLVCFACTAVGVACSILDIVCNWFGC